MDHACSVFVDLPCYIQVCGVTGCFDRDDPASQLSESAESRRHGNLPITYTQRCILSQGDLINHLAKNSILPCYMYRSV